MVVGPWGLVWANVGLMAHFVIMGVGMDYWAVLGKFGLFFHKKRVKGGDLDPILEEPTSSTSSSVESSELGGSILI